MKAFSTALRILRPAFHLPRDLSRGPHLSILLSLSRLLCVERNSALVCCIAGAPIVRLPAQAS
ncbi:hypothetical protein PS691_04479 [Pseudomonas fluorescens]|uniref:Uncharacterized protein n=1 Tax=Pseudomonas fluorescens TaxID=294 RepID=A0A5E7EF22_PSEFL|nr:hypothetical protein [Pseudomonas fluorescens]VVO24907.1 hypothetical protein PS691_04479 [Pseudomonas fluorescens]